MIPGQRRRRFGMNPQQRRGMQAVQRMAPQPDQRAAAGARPNDYQQRQLPGSSPGYRAIAGQPSKHPGMPGAKPNQPGPYSYQGQGGAPYRGLLDQMNQEKWGGGGLSDAQVKWIKTNMLGREGDVNGREGAAFQHQLAKHIRSAGGAESFLQSMQGMKGFDRRTAVAKEAPDRYGRFGVERPQEKWRPGDQVPGGQGHQGQGGPGQGGPGQGGGPGPPGRPGESSWPHGPNVPGNQNPNFQQDGGRPQFDIGKDGPLLRDSSPDDLAARALQDSATPQQGGSDARNVMGDDVTGAARARTANGPGGGGDGRGDGGPNQNRGQQGVSGRAGESRHFDRPSDGTFGSRTSPAQRAREQIALASKGIPMTPGFEAEMRGVEQTFADTMRQLGIDEKMVGVMLDQAKDRALTNLDYQREVVNEEASARGMFNSGIRADDQQRASIDTGRQLQDLQQASAQEMADIGTQKAQAWQQFLADLGDAMTTRTQDALADSSSPINKRPRRRRRRG